MNGIDDLTIDVHANEGSTGKTNTKDPIPNWNPGFAHVDTNITKCDGIYSINLT